MMSVILAASCLLAIPPAADIDREVEKAMAQFRTPGLALVVVCGGRVVHLNGYGFASLESKAPVTPDTIFPLASCSKPFTSAMMATLVDDGKLGWDDKVQKHLPFFRLKDPLASERATLRDLLCHRTGLGSHSLLWYRSPKNLEDRVRSLAFLEPASDFRSEFHYQTVAFGAAGLAAERVGGMRWEELLQTRILRPLGMSATSPVEPPASASLARPHRRDKDGIVRAIERYSLRLPDPAGSVHSTVRDLGTFLRFNLSDGTLDGKSIVSQARLRETHEPNMVIPLGDFARRINPETVQITYGLGWIVQDYRGHKILLHGGAIDGFRAHLMLIPGTRVGIGILSNLDGSLCNFALANALADLFLELPSRPWIADIEAVESKDRADDLRRAAELRSRRPVGARPPLPLDSYVGVYTDDAYGDCEIVRQGGALTLKWRTMQFPLEHFQGQTFLVDDVPVRDAPLTFIAQGTSVTAIEFLDRTFRRRDANSGK